jgi:Icc protein
VSTIHQQAPAVPNNTVRILQITDTHLHAHREARMRGLNTYETFKAIIDRVENGVRKPDAVLATGDLVQDETRQGYDRFRKLVEKLDVPVHCLPGNHDSPDIMADVLSHPPFQYCGQASYGRWRLIMLNTVVRWDDGGRLDNEQLQFLDAALAACSEQFALVAMHHHPVPMGSHWLDGIGLRNADEFFAILDRHAHVRCITWGHVHQASERMRNGVTLLSSPSTCSQFLPDSDVFRLDLKPPGYRWLDLLPDGTVNSEIVWL